MDVIVVRFDDHLEEQIRGNIDCCLTPGTRYFNYIHDGKSEKVNSQDYFPDNTMGYSIVQSSVFNFEYLLILIAVTVLLFPTNI
jgi:hypothetical protein